MDKNIKGMSKSGLNAAQRGIIKDAQDIFKEKPCLKTVRIYYEALLSIKPYDTKEFVRLIKEDIEPFLQKAIRYNAYSNETKNECFKLMRDCQLMTARENFDSFLEYVEKNRVPRERFYQFRRHKMRTLIDELQKLYDGELDVLFLELPPRVGKSTIGIWFVVWYMAHFPSGTSLLCGHSAKLVKGFYTEILTLLTDKENYCFYDVFPELLGRVKTYAEYGFIDISTKAVINRRFKTFQCASIESALAGHVEAGHLLYLDDLIDGIEEALSPLRLQKKRDSLFIDVLQRQANNRVPILVIGTAWAVDDPADALFNSYKDDENYRVARIQVPAINEETGESNFNFYPKYGIGFDRGYYEKKRETMDPVSFNCIYQQKRVGREGMLFKIDEFELFDIEDIEEKENSGKFEIRKHAFIDVAWGGSDYLAMPIVYEIEKEYYLVDVVFISAVKETTLPMVMGRIGKWGLYKVYVEKNSAGGAYAEELQERLKANGIACKIEAENSSNQKNAKQVRIMSQSVSIQNIKILPKKKQTREYRDALVQLCTYQENGAKTDDMADALASMFEKINALKRSKTFIGRRRF